MFSSIASTLIRSTARTALASSAIASSASQQRWLNIQEYQTKELMKRNGVNTQNFRLATTEEEARKGAEELNAREIVVKAQVLAGGRGKGTFDNGFKGGVKVVDNVDDAAHCAGQMLGNVLRTKQAPNGILVDKVMVAEALNFERELYFAILMDRAFNGPVFVCSPMGGMDIEQVAEDHPDQIFKEPIDIHKGPQPEQTKKLAEKLGFTGDMVEKAQKQMVALYNMFINTDATMVEVNPLAEVDLGDVYAIDGKMNFDDNAEYRQKEIFSWRDEKEEDPMELEAAKFNLNYIKLDGSIGCMVNGAGLAMATMDIIKLYGKEPANFLDVGGGANESQVTEAFKIIMSDKNISAILVNIFGGIVRCDVIASGIIAAWEKVGRDNMPLIVRLSGTNAEIGKKLLAESGMSNIISADDLDDAAQKTVASVEK